MRRISSSFKESSLISQRCGWTITQAFFLERKPAHLLAQRIGFFFFLEFAYVISTAPIGGRGKELVKNWKPSLIKSKKNSRGGSKPNISLIKR